MGMAFIQPERIWSQDPCLGHSPIHVHFPSLRFSSRQWNILKLTYETEASHERTLSENSVKHVMQGTNMGFIIFLLISNSGQEMAVLQVFNILYI